MAGTIELTVNGQALSLDVDTHLTLLDLLRHRLGLNGPKYGCGMAQCGACTVLVDGAPARACVLRAVKANGTSITTLEGLPDTETGEMHPVQQAFDEEQAAQCGYCINGMIMNTVALLARNPSPTDDEIRQAHRHHLCRCGTHLEILAAVRTAAENLAAKTEEHAR
tara:strand:- start:5994 stop:6491 length:498 start_codon:yes stop_codon:yes gene_type:complete